ncbi:MAG TPA: MoaD/ThiS family protein [Candidatus Bathyarchaeota archaeon]|nr:MAG: hypothetical protein DRO34_02350 [Candidatus Bathyarchaeota archaeon]HDI07271.1 MoaD/ThiS family protein [Candidatus Bathyarchaeota archaeon]
MTRISVRFFTVLRELIGQKEIVVEFAERHITVERLLESLVRRYGKEFKEYVFDPVSNDVRGHLQLLVNGRNIASLSGLDTRLEDGDVFAIIPPVGGG